MMRMMMMVTVSTSLSHCCTLTSTLLYALVFASCILVNVSGDKKPWSHDEQSAVLRHLAVLMTSGSIPGKAAIIAVLPANQCLSLGRGRRLRTSVATVYMSQHSARSVCLFIRVFRRCNVGQKMVICMQYDAVWK